MTSSEDEYSDDSLENDFGSSAQEDDSGSDLIDDDELSGDEVLAGSSEDEDVKPEQDKKKRKVEPQKDTRPANRLTEALNQIISQGVQKGKTPILSKEKGLDKAVSEEAQKEKEVKEEKLDRAAYFDKDRVIPDFSTREKERALLRVSTRGVVKLFNAVRQHQKTSEFDQLHEIAAQKSKRLQKVNRMTKTNFLDMLKQPKGAEGTSLGKPGPSVGTGSAPGPDGAGDKRKWDVLSQDYMTKGHWEKTAEASGSESD